MTHCGRLRGVRLLFVPLVVRVTMNWRNDRQVATFEVLTAVLLGYYVVLTGKWFSYQSTRRNVKIIQCSAVQLFMDQLIEGTAGQW